MIIKIIAVGKLKEKCLKDACAEYEKRLSRFCKVNICEIPDLKNPDLTSNSLCQGVIKKEGKEILKKLTDGFTIALCIEGVQKTSLEFAEIIESAAMKKGKVNFLIGGSLGLSDEVKERADLMVSISKMTFPHGIARMLLLEQVYRGYKILSNENYHK